jgi:anti-sigma B factor antagonist
MKFKTKELKGVTVVTLYSNMMGGPDAATLHLLLHELVEKGKMRIVIDLNDVKSVNSSGLGILIGGLTTMKNAGGDLKLANVSSKIQTLLVVTKLDSIFEQHSSVDKAVASFK